MSEWIYGFHAVEGVIKRSPERITALWLATNRRDKRAQEIEALAQTQGVAVTRVERYQLDMEIDGRHQGIAVSVQGDKAVAEVLTEASLVASVASGRFNLLLVLDGVTDPHNLGACLRSADAAGVHAVVVPKNNSAEVNAVVSKVACGAAEVIPLVPVTNLARTLLALQGAGAWIVGTSGDAEQFIYDVDMTGHKDRLHRSQDPWQHSYAVYLHLSLLKALVTRDLGTCTRCGCGLGFSSHRTNPIQNPSQ